MATPPPGPPSQAYAQFQGPPRQQPPYAQHLRHSQAGPYPSAPPTHLHPQRQSSYGVLAPESADARGAGPANTSYQSLHSPLSHSPVGGAPAPPRQYPPPGHPPPPQQQQQPQQQFNPAAISRHSPAPSTSNTSHTRDGSGATTRPTTQLPSSGSSRSIASQAVQQPQTIAGEPLHDLQRAVALLKSSKFYAEGFLMKKVEATPDGRMATGPDGQWAKWFVQLSGNIMSTWNAADMEAAARENRTVPPHYLNLQDSFVHPLSPHRGQKTPTQFQFVLNSAGQNRILFCAPSLQSLMMWINGIRLSIWERSRCNEIWTGSLLGTREPRPLGWQGYDAGLPAAQGSSNSGKASSTSRFEGWLKVRLPGETEWRRVWCVVHRGSNVPTRANALNGDTSGAPATTPAEEKKSRRSSLLSFGVKKEKKDEISLEDVPGSGAVSTLLFYDHKPTKKDQPVCIAQHVYYASAVFPESEQLMEHSTLFKIEGTFLSPHDKYTAAGWGVGGRGDKQGFALVMLEEGHYRDMLYWIVGISDAFKLYGRPRNFSFDPRDPNSLYFALPIGPHRDRQFLDRELVDNLKIDESRPRAVRATFHNILFDRMRGIVPTALANGPAPQDSRTGSSSGAGTPTSPVDDERRRWSQQPPPQSRNDSPQLPPILPTIGEGSLVDDPQGPPSAVTTDAPPTNAAAVAVEPQGVDARRLSLHRQSTADRRRSQYGVLENDSVPPQPAVPQQDHQQPVSFAPPARQGPSAPPVDHLGDTGLRRASRGGSSAENELSTYAAYLSSDIARERTPPPPVPSMPSRSSYHDPARLVAPIDTNTNKQAPSSTGSTPNPLPVTAATENAETPLSDTDRSIKTHLTWLGGPRPEHTRYDQHTARQASQQHLSPVYPLDSPARQRLPSPGAVSNPPLDLDEEERAGAPPSPGLPYLAGSPAAGQTGFEQPIAAAPAAPVPPSVPPPAPPVPIVAAKPANEPSVQADGAPKAASEAALPRSLLEAGPAHSEVSAGTRVSQAHDGKVVDSPEDLPVATPVDSALSTQPLFASSSSARASEVPAPAVEGQPVHGAPAQTAATEPAQGLAEIAQPERTHVPTAREPLHVETQQRAPVEPQHSVSSPQSAAPLRGVPQKAGTDEYNIHSDLIAALNFVDRSDSPEPYTPHTMSTEMSPAMSMQRHQSVRIGPSKKGIFDPPTPSDEHYGQADEVLAQPSTTTTTSAAPSASGSVSSTSVGAPSFPSSFANNKREERAAAAQLAQQAQQKAQTRPGRAVNAVPKKKKMWEDSDEDEEDAQEDEDESSEEDAGPRSQRVQHSTSTQSLGGPSPPALSRGASPIPPSVSMDMAPQQRVSHSPHRPSAGAIDPAARQSYLDNGPGINKYAAGPPPASPTRYDGQPETAPTEGQPHRKPALNPHGLLATGMLEKEERSARAQEYAARDTGGTLVSLPAKPLPPQTGLVGAITSHQREKERTGGVGRALTEQQRERKLAEQRQKQLDEMQKQQLAMFQQQQQMQMAQFGGGAGAYGSMGYGSNPWMMGGGMGMGGMPGFGGFGAFPSMPNLGSQLGGGSPQLQPQHPGNASTGDQQSAQAFQQQQAMFAAQAAAQQAAQQVAQQAAQQAYMAAMSQFQQGAPSPGGASPTLPPTSFPSMPSMPFMPAPFGFPASPTMGFSGFVPGHGQQASMSMYGGGMPGSQFGGAGAMPQPGGDAENGTARAVSPLDLKTPQPPRRDASD